MKSIIRVIKNNYKFILGTIFGLILSVTSVYAIDAYIESKNVSYDNKYTDKNNTQEAIDELYERSGLKKTKWIDPILNGADPELKDPLIPVEIKPNGKVYKANLYSEWYNYSEKRWANAVILNDGKTTNNYKEGDEILNTDIKGYFVWIPRYQYKVWNMANTDEYSNYLSGTFTNENYATSPTNILGNARIIDIKFGNVNAAPKMEESAAKLGEYYTHPAFTLGDKNLNGIWVGKFETGGSVDNIIVKPNEISLRNQIVSTFYKTAKNFDSTLKSHMLKNTEWGAIAYLSHSSYGIGGQINMNNNNQYKTGYSSYNADQSSYTGTSGNDDTVTRPWNTPTGYLASTTGNISGIYDMSGGAHEYVAGYCKSTSNADKSGFTQAELTAEVNSGYMDEYVSSTGASFNSRILGDATGEVGPFYMYKDKDGSNRIHNSWYNDASDFVNPSYPWFRRGGHWRNGILASQFDFIQDSGVANPDNGFRLAFAIN